MTAGESNRSWKTRLSKNRGVRIAGCVGSRILDFILPVQDATYRQRESLIRYRQASRFRDPIHGMHIDPRPVPNVRTLQLVKTLDRWETKLRILFEEKLNYVKQ